VLEGSNLINADVNSWTVRDTYRVVEPLSQILTNNSRPVAVIAEFVGGNVAEIRRSASEANSMISMTQMFTAAATSIYSNLSQMQQLADSAAHSLNSDRDKAAMQQEFQQLAEEVNEQAENTEYDGNQLFTADGRRIYIPAGDGPDVYLFPRDLSFDADGLDLTTEPETALTRVRSAVAIASEYSRDMAGELERLEDAMATYDRELDTMDINSSGFTSAVAAKTGKNITKQIRENSEQFLKIQGNVIPERAAYLL
jgi:flagellin